jgi:hypothetical protein
VDLGDRGAKGWIRPVRSRDSHRPTAGIFLYPSDKPSTRQLSINFAVSFLGSMMENWQETSTMIRYYGPELRSFRMRSRAFGMIDS